MNVNRKNLTAYAGATAGTGNPEQDCSLLATGAALDLCQWNNALLGASEKSAANASIGAMIDARGCITQINPATETYIVAVAWQGLAATAAPGNTCAQNLYGNDALRRVVTLTFRIGDLL
jgi:type IV pilus assembly protein PilV